MCASFSAGGSRRRKAEGMPARRKVYVTGMGAVCCLGGSVREFWQAVLSGACGLRRIERFNLEGSPYDTGGEAAGVKLVAFPKRRVSMGAQLATHAAQEAVAELPPAGRERLAVVLSTNFGPSEVMEGFLDDQWVAPRFGNLTRGMLEGPFAWDVDYVAEAVGAWGERVNVSLSCSSGNAAIARGLELIRTGASEAVLAGGYDSMQKIVWAGLAALRVMAVGAGGEPPRVRPFDRHRSGTLFSEGAGALLLESEEHARRRGALLLAEVAGAGSNNNAYHMTHADDEGLATAEAIQMALQDAGTPPEAVDHINAHGTGTKLNDVIETRSFRRVFGVRAAQIPVTSLKGGLGHAMGAASSLEAIACVLTLREGVIPPTAHYETPDPECDVDVVANQPRQAPVRCIVNNSAGIGGANAVVVLKKVS